jgi:hypothetical protein
VNHGKGGDLCDVAQASELFQRFLGGRGEPLQLPHHQLHDIIGAGLRVDAFHIPSPGQRDRIEREQTLFGQSRDELDREKRIASGFIVHQMRQRPCTLRLAMKAVGNELSDIVDAEWRQHDLMNACAGFSDHLERPHERVCRSDLVVPVSRDQQQV